MNKKHFTWLGFVLLFAAIGLPSAVFGQQNTLKDLTITGQAFTEGSGNGFAVSGAGLTMDETALTAVYTSPILNAPIQFNAVVPRWQADLPEGATMALTLRTRPNGGAWSDWFDIHPNADWDDPSESVDIGEMFFVPPGAETNREFQYSISYGRSNLSLQPLLSEITFTFINSTAGPTTDELIEQQQALDAQQGVHQVQSGYPRPTVISREVWCTSPDCDYTAGLTYKNATHLIVHHTVSQNYGSNYNWAAVVRAVWNYHTYSNGWGDIGYNYLIDINGVIYEGHMNADYLNKDVVGTHASGANTGSMAVSLLGTFTAPDYSIPGIKPSDAMLNSLVEILAWKADQRNINVFDASDTLPGVDWGLPHLMGHRDVYGTTECPGDQAHELLPWLRQQVADKIGLVDPYMYVEETDPGFTKSNTNWYEGPNGCGHNGHSYYTWSTNSISSSSNWGEWQLNVPEDGLYRIEVYAPYCRTGRSETAGATYSITHKNGTSDVVVSHEAELGLWTSLGEYQLETGGNNAVYLSDLTTTDSGLGVWFDAIRLLKLDSVPPVETAVTLTQPTANSWTNQPQVSFNWTISTTAPTIMTTTLKIATNAAMTNTVYAKTWPAQTESHSHTFTQDYPALYWQVTTTTDNGLGQLDTVTSDVGQFGIDTVKPTSAVNKVFLAPNGEYILVWQGQDNASSVASYDVDYRSQGETAWTPLLTNTPYTYSLFSPADPNKVYEFRSRAIDKAGNGETAHTAVDITTEEAIELKYSLYLPLITH